MQLTFFKVVGLFRVNDLLQDLIHNQCKILAEDIHQRYSTRGVQDTKKNKKHLDLNNDGI